VKTLRRLYDDDLYGLACPTCGSKKSQRRGIKRTKTMNYQQYQCNNCLRYFKYALIGRAGPAGL